MKLLCGFIELFFLESLFSLLNERGIAKRATIVCSNLLPNAMRDRYGERIGNFGGIDTDVLCRQSPEYIRDYVLDSLSRTAGHGGIAFASGNSIPDYVPTEGYLAMVETVRDWRGDKAIS